MLPIAHKRLFCTCVGSRSACETFGACEVVRYPKAMAGLCALGGTFREGCAHCRNGGGRAVRTGGIVQTGLCALPAAISVHTPVKTWSAVRTAGHDGKPSAHTPAGTRSAVRTAGSEGRRGFGPATFSTWTRTDDRAALFRFCRHRAAASADSES